MIRAYVSTENNVQSVYLTSVMLGGLFEHSKWYNIPGSKPSTVSHLHESSHYFYSGEKFSFPFFDLSQPTHQWFRNYLGPYRECHLNLN